ncbi:MAG: hypothetical protein ACTHMV_18435 [Chitinophagaceae bacterium]
MKRKSIYLFFLICFMSMISSARQRYYSSALDMGNTINEVAKTKAPPACGAGKGEGFDLSPVGFFVLNM